MKVTDWLSTEIGQNIWSGKYQYNNETFDEWLDRISNGNDKIKQMAINKEFLFAGRILANRGLHKFGKKVTYSNCYVISPPEDNIESIFDTSKKLARTYSYGGGAGTDCGLLRPNGSKVNNAAETTSGLCSFVAMFSMVTEIIAQKGRRGALMISLPIHHPDVEEFIDLKTESDKVTKANISVKIDNKFMEAVKNDDDYELSFTIKSTGEVISKTIKAKELFMKLVQNNYDWGEPGILFWDRINSYNLMSEDSKFSYAGVNPCKLIRTA